MHFNDIFLNVVLIFLLFLEKQGKFVAQQSNSVKTLCKLQVMNSPSFDVVSCAFPPYLVPTIDKYLRADIGCTISVRNLPHAQPQFTSIEGRVLSYHQEPSGLLVSDGHDPLALLEFKSNPDLHGKISMVPLSLTRFLVIGASCVTLYDVETGIHQLVKQRTNSTLQACRLDASTFVLGERGLEMFTYVGGGITRLRHWPLRMHQVAVDHLVGMPSCCFLAARGNVLEVYDPASVPGIRSVTLPYRPQSVVAGRASVLIANEQTVFVYDLNLIAQYYIQVRNPITALAELADGCVAIASDRELEIWKAAKLHHTYKLAFTPSWMAVENRELVCAEDNVLYTFLKGK